MSISSLIHRGGLALILAGLLFFAADLIGRLAVWGLADEVPLSQAATAPAYLYLNLGYLIAALLLLLGVFGLYLRQAESAGGFGLIAFLVALVGIVLTAGAIWTFAFVPPALVDVAPEFLDADQAGGALDIAFLISFSLFPIGLALLAISSMVSRAIPRSWAIVALVGIVGGFALQISTGGVLNLIGSALNGAAQVSLGIGLRMPAGAVRP